MSWNDWILQKNIDFTLDKLAVSKQDMVEYLEKSKKATSISKMLGKLNNHSEKLDKQFKGPGHGQHAVLDHKHLVFPKALPSDVCIHSDYGDYEDESHVGRVQPYEYLKEHMWDRNYAISKHMKSLGYELVDESRHVDSPSSRIMQSHLFRKSRELSKSDEENEEPDWKRAGLTIKDTNDRKTGHLNLPLLTDYKSFHNMEPDELLINREDMKSKKPSKSKKKLKF